MARVTQRCQEVQVRTWCSSRPARPLLAWMFSSIVHRRPAMAYQGGQGDGLWCVAAVEGQFPGARVAADQQLAAPGPRMPTVTQAQS